MNSINALRIDPSTDVPEPCKIDLDDVGKFLRDEAPGPAVYVLEERDLAALLAAVKAIDESLIIDRGEQNVTVKEKEARTTRLMQSLGSKKGHVAQRVRYVKAGKLVTGVRMFLARLAKAKRPRPYLFFLGTSPEIWRELERRVGKVTPEHRDLRALRQIYVGRSRAAEAVRLGILLAVRADLDVVILVSGESGTGKEDIARAIHQFSRRTGMFRDLNCAAIPSSMADAALFGHERGAFTGAVARMEGYFEQADGGTLFLDEIGEMTAETQAKILRAVQDRRIYRIGASKSVPVDVKIVAATNRNLDAMIQRGEFREDLIHRVAGLRIATPNLREHREDLELHIARIWQGQYQRPRLPSGVMQLLRSWDWPGNVRELKNTLRLLHLVTETGERAATPELLADILNKKTPGLSTVIAAVPRRAGKVTTEILAQRVQRYPETRPGYVILEQTLRTIVERIVKHLAPLTIVRSCTLTLARFAEQVRRMSQCAGRSAGILARSLRGACQDVPRARGHRSFAVG